MSLILASQSPRRRALLALLTKNFTVSVSPVNEDSFSASSPASLCACLASEKATAVFSKFPHAAILACDTVVDLDGRVLGKPKDHYEAVTMLTALSGRRHEVHTGVCLLQKDKEARSFVETTHVVFDSIPKQEIMDIAETTEPYDKAGAYGIQGWAARFIPRIEGCYYNVMGLPVASLQKLLAQENLL